jgi:hypothetical protein
MIPSTHWFITLFLFGLWPCLWQPIAVNANHLDPTVQCNKGSNVCAYYMATTPNNSTSEYGVNFFLVKGLKKGESVLDCPKKKKKRRKKKGCGETDESVTVKWDKDNVCKEISTDKGKCKSCTTCNITGELHVGSADFSATFSADCTSLSSGRIVTCEPLFPVFYPLDALESATRKPCGDIGAGCIKDADCCGNNRCSKWSGCIECTTSGSKCLRNDHCCPGLTCRLDKNSRKGAKKCTT